MRVPNCFSMVTTVCRELTLCLALCGCVSHFNLTTIVRGRYDAHFSLEETGSGHFSTLLKEGQVLSCRAGPQT